MQINEKNAEFVQNFSKKKSPLAELSRQVRLTNFAHELRDKTFAERFELLYYLATVISFASQLLSMWSSYLAVHTIVSMKAQGELSIAITVLMLTAIEAVKYTLVTISFSQMFSLRPTYPYAIICLTGIVSAGSMYLCIIGSTEIAKDKTTEKQLTAEQASKEKELKNQIDQIQNTDTYKNVIWNGNGSTSKVITEVGKALVQKRETELDSLRKTYQAKTNAFQTQQATAQARLNYIFAIFEALFLLSSYSIYYYKRLSAIEAGLYEHLAHTPEAPSEPVRTYLQTTEPLREVVRELPEVVRTSPELPELRTDSATAQDTSPEVVRTDTAKQNCEAKLRSDTPEPQAEQAEAEFLVLIDRFTNGRRAYLEKYKEVVITILECQKRNVAPTNCMEICTARHSIGKTTYYGIQRILNEIKAQD